MWRRDIDRAVCCHWKKWYPQLYISRKHKTRIYAFTSEFILHLSLPVLVHVLHPTCNHPLSPSSLLCTDLYSLHAVDFGASQFITASRGAVNLKFLRHWRSKNASPSVSTSRKLQGRKKVAGNGSLLQWGSWHRLWPEGKKMQRIRVSGFLDGTWTWALWYKAHLSVIYVWHLTPFISQFYCKYYITGNGAAFRFLEHSI
jgi:hypothetical protein